MNKYQQWVVKRRGQDFPPKCDFVIWHFKTQDFHRQSRSRVFPHGETEAQSMAQSRTCANSSVWPVWPLCGRHVYVSFHWWEQRILSVLCAVIWHSLRLVLGLCRTVGIRQAAVRPVPDISPPSPHDTEFCVFPVDIFLIKGVNWFKNMHFCLQNCKL